MTDVAVARGMGGWHIALAVAVGCSLAAATPASAALPAGNLLANPGAEAGLGGSNETVIDPPPGWTSSGSLTATQYGGTGFPTAAQSAEIGGGNNFFAGGNTAVATGTQTIDVSGAASEIDAGTVPASLSRFLGGYAGQADTMSVTATYLGGSNNQLGSLQIGPVTTADRGGLTGLLPRSASGAVPAGTRAIQVVMTSTRVEGTSNDGYGDNLAFALSDKRPTATRVTCNRGPDLFSNSVCTAAVADIGLAPPVAPTGSVRFVTPRGSFDFGDTCQLTSSASSPSTASCSVTYVPSEAGSPAGLPIPVAAGYLGDAVHAPSGAATTPAVNVTAGLIPDPPLASECAAAGRSAVARATSRPRGAIAYGALNTFHYPNENSSFGDRASYGAHLCMDSAQGLLGYVVQGIGYALPVAVGIAAAIDPEPTSKTGLYAYATARPCSSPQRVALVVFAQPSSDRAVLRNADSAGLLTMPVPDCRRRPE